MNSSRPRHPDTTVEYGPTLACTAQPAISSDRAQLRAVALQAGRGDMDRLSELVAASRDQVRSLCSRLVDRHSADDLVQETYLRAAKSLPGYRGESDPVRWLLTIARRVCADEIAQRQRLRAITHRVGCERIQLPPGPALSVEIADAIARLSRDRREAFVLTAVAGLSYAEAAARCRCPVGTIRSRVARARSDLMAMLELNAKAAGPKMEAS